MVKAKTAAVGIIGAGPAGMAAAIQLSHYGMKPVLFAQNPNGSLLKNAWRVTNYLGFGAGITGKELLKKFQSQLAKHNIRLIRRQVILLKYNSKSSRFIVRVAGKKQCFFDFLIVATGTEPKLLGNDWCVKAKPRLFYEVFPLLKLRHKTVLIVGGGDAACDNALNLAKFNKIIVCNRSKSTNTLPILLAKVKNHPNITYYNNCKVQRIVTKSCKKNLGFALDNFGKHVYIEADYVLAAIGRLPNKDYYHNTMRLMEKKLVKQGRLFLVGDVKNSIYRQIAIASGDGVMAAMKIFRNIFKYDATDH